MQWTTSPNYLRVLFNLGDNIDINLPYLFVVFNSVGEEFVNFRKIVTI